MIVGLVIKLQKYKLEPSTIVEFWGVEVNSVDMTIYLQETRLTDITSLCEKFLLEKSKLFWEVDFNILSNLSASLHCHSLQMYQITKLSENLL